MRKLMIRFKYEGDYFREIDENRHYFLTEAEMIVSTIRNRIEKDKREVLPKTFELWLDGILLIVTHVSFDGTETLEQQLHNTIQHYEEWEDEIRHKYMNLLKANAKEERLLFVNKEFESFVIRFDEVLGSNENGNIPLLLDLNKTAKIFDNVSTYIETGFYAEMEQVIETVKLTYKTVQSNIQKELAQLENKDTQDRSFLTVRLKTWMANEDNFQLFIHYIIARYQSVSDSRINALASHFPAFQKLQNILFREYTSVIGFDEALKFHNEVMNAFYKKYQDILFKGFPLKSDDNIVSLVISPVCNTYLIKLDEKKAIVEKNLENWKQVMDDEVETDRISESE